MVENPQGQDFTGALSALPEKKAESQIRCDRLIASHYVCFGKQDKAVSLMRNSPREDRRHRGIAAVEGREGKVVEKETAKVSGSSGVTFLQK